jgi:MATE family multidrug resistance protein
VLYKNSIKDVLKLAIPAVGEMILYMTIWVLDTIMVGQYGGKLSVSTVGISSEIIYTFINIFISVGISIGIASIVARKVGAKKYDSASEYATIGFSIGMLISLIIFLCIFILPDKILTLAGAEEDVINLGIIYMKIASIGMLFNMLMNMLNGVLRGYGNTKTPLIASIIINIINLFLDYSLIFGHFNFPELGVKGAAIATSIAQFSGFLFIAFYTYKTSKIKINFLYLKNIKKHKLKEILKLSIPSSMQQGSLDFSRLLSTFIIMRIGTVAFAANQITTTIESLSFMPAWGFSVAATTLVGHKIGEKNIKKAKEYAYTCATLGCLLMLLCSILFLSAPKFLISLFIKSSEKEVINLGIICLMIAALEQVPMGISMILGGALKGYGDTKTPFVISLISSWLIRLPLIFYFISILKLSVIYVWWITSIQWIFEGLTIFLLFKKKIN